MSRPRDAIGSMLYGRGRYGGPGFGAAGTGTYGGYGQFAPGGYGGGYGVFGPGAQNMGYGSSAYAMAGFGSPYGSGAGYVGGLMGTPGGVTSPYSADRTPYGYTSFGGFGSLLGDMGAMSTGGGGGLGSGAQSMLGIAADDGSQSFSAPGQRPEQQSQAWHYEDPFPRRGFDPHTMGLQSGYRQSLLTSGPWTFSGGRWTGGNPNYQPRPLDPSQRMNWNLGGIEGPGARPAKNPWAARLGGG